MSFTPTSIPSLPPSTDPALRQFLTALKENLEVRLKQRGRALDASPTFQDLVDTGLLTIKDGANIIGGKTYSRDQLLGLVNTSFPTWITSDTAPGAPTGLVVTTDKTNTILRWDASDFDTFSHTEVWRATQNNLSTAEKVGASSGVVFTDGLPDPGIVYYYWIRHVAQNYLVGSFNDVNGTATSLGPDATSVAYTFIGTDVEFTWPTPSSNLAVSLYLIEYDNGGLWTKVDLVAGNSFRAKALWNGTRQFRIAAYDINENKGPYSTFSVTVDNNVAPLVTTTFEGESLVLSWSAPAISLPVDHYEVFDTSVSTATLVGFQYSTVFKTKVTWQSKTYLVRAVDSAGNAGPTRSVVVSVALPRVYKDSVGDDSFRTQVIDNNVLFYWSLQAGSLPIAAVELRRGSTWASAEVVGKKDGGFTTLFEAPQSTVTYTYWLAAVDTAGNYGTPASATATVSQPPDYLLAVKVDSLFNGTLNNAVLDPSGSLVLPVNTSETYAAHFTSRSWAGPSDQVAAGYPVFIQPTLTSGYYEEVYDYGATLAAMKVSVAYLLTTVAGTVSAAVTITTATDAGFTTNVQTFNAAEAYVVNFRYIKYRVTITATDDKGVAQLDNLSLKLDTKLKTQTGSVSCSASDSGGTTVYLTDTKLSTGPKTFIDVQSINVSAQGTTPTYAIYDFVDDYAPLSFKILLFNSSGTRVSGVASYQVRGY